MAVRTRDDDRVTYRAGTGQSVAGGGETTGRWRLSMKAWEEDFLTSLRETTETEAVFVQILAAARSLGFERCAYGLRLPLPIAEPKVFMINNYPPEWRERYAQAGYLEVDPTVSHGRRSQSVLVWSDALFAGSPTLWDEAQSFGLNAGFAQSNFDSTGAIGMLTLSRLGPALSTAELREIEPQIRCLVSASHDALSRSMAPAINADRAIHLTTREVEVLKWIADGKTSREISNILRISLDTVNFHVKNATSKLQATNKTAAVVRSIMLGLLD